MSKTRKNVFEQGVETYSINLLWENRKKQEDQSYIYPAKDKEELLEQIFKPCIKWAKENRQADVKIWYDSKLVTNKALENTEQILVDISKAEECTNITLNDIRKINFVNENEILFTQRIDVYFRVDYLKLVILAHELIAKDNDGAVFADFKVCDLRTDDHGNITGKRFNKEELFGLEYMDKLKQFGLLTNIKMGMYPENQFIQIVNDEVAVDALRHVINACAMRAIDLLNTPQNIQENLATSMFNIPFYSTIHETSKLYMGMKAHTIEVNVGFIEDGIPNDKWTQYDPEKHGYKPLGNAMTTGKSSYINSDLSGNSRTEYSLDKSIKFGFDVNDCEGQREGFVHGGNDHVDEFTFQEHEPFVPHYWSGDSNNFYEVEPLGID